MKTTILLSALLLVTAWACKKDDDISVPKIEGLSLYWDHEVFGDLGRRLRFQAYTTNRFDNDYDLEFSTSIEGRSITVKFAKSIDKGKCPSFPMPRPGSDDPHKCHASGGLYLLEKELENGVYSLNMITPYFETTSKLIVTDEIVTLEIPENEYLQCAIQEVYPIPKNLLFGGITYSGSDNTNDAKEFLNRLEVLGLIETTVPDYNYRHLSVDKSGRPVNDHWEPDNHAIRFLYDMSNSDFREIFEEAKEHFNRTNLSISLFTSNGDEGHLSKLSGIHVVYAQER